MKREIDFIGKKKIFFTISIVLMVLMVVLTPFLVKLDTMFTGGSITSYPFQGEIDLGEFKSTAESAIGQSVSITTTSDFASDSKQIVVTVSQKDSLPQETLDKMDGSLREKFADNKLGNAETVNVSATMGQEFFIKCLIAIAAASVLMIIYIAFRFRKIGGWSAGVMAVLALLFDGLMVYLSFLVCGFSLNANFMAAFLTILGYSINNTIVIYDRIRENEKLYGNKMPVAKLVNASVNQTLGRTINTTVSTVLALTVVTVVALVLNITEIISFSLPLIVGMVSGTFTSTCVTTALWVTWQEHKEKQGKMPKKA